MPNPTAKVKIFELGLKRAKSWFVKFTDGPGEWVPYSVIQGYNPITKQLTVETWWLNNRGIKYNL